MFPAIKSCFVYILIADLKSCFPAVGIMPAVNHIFYYRRGLVYLKSVGRSISLIACVVGQLRIDHILILIGNAERSVVFIEAAFLYNLFAQSLCTDKVFDLN